MPNDEEVTTQDYLLCNLRLLCARKCNIIHQFPAKSSLKPWVLFFSTYFNFYSPNTDKLVERSTQREISES